jgi:hypothetical protein
VRYRSAIRRLTVPKRWTRSVQNALVNVMSLAHYALLSTRSWAANAANQRVRLSAKTDQLTHEIRLLREELRIKDARLARIPASRRPHYQPTERLAILELRALRGWSLAQTARVFLVTPPTIAAWFKRLDDHGPALDVRRVGAHHWPGNHGESSHQKHAAYAPRTARLAAKPLEYPGNLHGGLTPSACMVVREQRERVRDRSCSGTRSTGSEIAYTQVDRGARGFP